MTDLRNLLPWINIKKQHTLLFSAEIDARFKITLKKYILVVLGIIFFLPSLPTNSTFATESCLIVFTIFASFVYIFYDATRYKRALLVVIYIHVIVQCILFIIIILSNAHLFMIFFMYACIYDIIAILFIPIICFCMVYLIYKIKKHILLIEYLKYLSLLIITVIYSIFYCLVSIFLILVLCYMLTDQEFLLFQGCILYFYININILIKTVNLHQILKILTVNYLIYILILFTASGFKVFLDNLVFLLSFLSTIYCVWLFCKSRYSLTHINQLYLLKFINIWCFIIIICSQLVGLYICFYTFESVLIIGNFIIIMLGFSIQLILCCAYLKVLLHLILTDKYSFIRLFNNPTIFNSENPSIGVLGGSCLIFFLVLFILGLIFVKQTYFFDTDNWSVDNFEYRTHRRMRRRRRYLTRTQVMQLTQVFGSKKTRKAYPIINPITYEQSLEAFREHLARYGFVVRKRKKWFPMRDIFLMKEIANPVKLALGMKFRKGFENMHYIHRFWAIERMHKFKREIPDDIIQPLFDLYIDPRTGLMRSNRLGKFAKAVMFEFNTSHTVHTRSTFTLWDANKARIHKGVDIETVNKYFQMVYELSWVRKLNISLELCKLLVDLYDVDIHKKGVTFAQYINVITKMYTDFDHQVDVDMLLDSSWWLYAKKQLWWLDCNIIPVKGSAEQVEKAWTQFYCSDLVWEEMYKEINFRMGHDKKSRRHIFNYPFTYNDKLQRWVPKVIFKPKPTVPFWKLWWRSLFG